MPPRKTPTHQELIQALLDRTPLLNQPVVWSAAFAAIKQEFRTTNPRATQWLRDIVEMESGRPLELLDVDRHGHVATVHRAQGKWARDNTEDSAWVSDPLSVLGYLQKDANTLYIDDQGGFRSAPTEHRGAGSQYFVVLRQVLDDYADQARAARIARTKARVEDQARWRAEAEVERRHGNAPDYFRGLLAAAGVPHDGKRQFRLQLWDPGSNIDVGTTAYLELDDGEIDLVARFLAEQGVQPITASEYRKTRKK